MCGVCLYGKETEREREVQKNKTKKRGEDRRGETERLTGQQEKCGGSMSASDKGISLPPVGLRERLTLQALPLPWAHTCMHTHLSLWMSALLSGTSQQIIDKTCTWQTPTTKLSITGVTLWTTLSKHRHTSFSHPHNYYSPNVCKKKKSTPLCCEQKERRDVSQGCRVQWDWRLFHVRHGIHPKWSKAFYLPS